VPAIYADEDVPTGRQHFTPLSAELSREWKPITKTQLALPDADARSRIEPKLGELKR
jgi:ferredoxin